MHVSFQTIAFTILTICILSVQFSRALCSEPVIIAHRGACGYLPEHTEGAKVLALAQGADFIEQDVVLSKDRIFVVAHDVTMEDTTNVEERFPDRKRADGKYYFADFDWSEIRSLAVHERTNAKTHQQAFATRFPGSFHQKPMQLEEEIKLIQGWNQVTGRNVGLYVELKAPAWHQKEFGTSMGALLLPVLAQYGYADGSSKCYLQCFEAEELRDLKAAGCRLKLIQLLGKQLPPDATDWMDAMLDIKTYASGVGPSIEGLVECINDQPRSTGLMEAARKTGLLVHPYTVRRDQLPACFKSIDELHRLLIDELQVDGFFTDFPDLSVAAKR